MEKRYTEFCQAVLEQVPRATWREREELLEELTDHLEEHQAMLEDHGWEPGAAAEKAVEAMGAAAEIGRQWNARLSPFWLWAGRLCQAVCILLVVCLVSPLSTKISGIADNLLARQSWYQPNFSVGSTLPTVREENVDVRGELGEHVIRIYKVRYGGRWNTGWQHLTVYLLAYPKDPRSSSLDTSVIMQAKCNGEKAGTGGSTGGPGPGYSCCAMNYTLANGVEEAEITLDWNGNSFAATLDLRGRWDET